jgi:hypothetical protein
MSDQLSVITNIVFIDAAVPDYQTLIEGLPVNSTYFVLDAQKDGVAQIEQCLAGYSNLDSIQILSHGSQGSLYLGNAVLSNNTLKNYQDQLANIGRHLKDTGDILLYGCNVAQGDTGLQFINALAKATGADVAASNDITGSAALGGDWLLETNTGSIEVAGALSANIQATYAGSLVIPVVTITAGITPVEGAAGSFIVTLDSPAPVGGLTINYSMSGTATLNTDYTVAAGTHVSAITGASFTIAAGQTTASLTVNAASLDVYDPNETIDLSLLTGSSYSFVSNVTTFGSNIDYATGTSADSVTVGDFNGDGKTDLAIANGNSSSVSVLFRNAANTGFDAKIDLTTGYYPFPISVSAGDFNGDGKVDLAVANQNNNTVSVLLRNSANTSFDSNIDIITDSLPQSVVVGDFNGDGKTDLAVVNAGSNTVSVFLRNSSNTSFDSKVDFATGPSPCSVSNGDFNDDGKLDLAIANRDGNTVSVLLRNIANTGFEPKLDYATGLEPRSVSVGDFNGDGKTDLAVANGSSNTVSVLLRNAANTDFEPKMDFATGIEPLSVSEGDFNGDGKVDLAVANMGSNTVSILLRNAANTNFEPKVDFATGSGPISLSEGDFNGDGKTDLAVANFYSNTVSVLFNNTTPNASLTITDTHINTPPQLPVISPSNISGTLSAADATNPFNASNYFDAYTPAGFINGTAMSLALSSTAFDTYLQVIRNGSVFAFNDDSNGTTNSLIHYTYQTGDKIYATSSGGLVTEAYSLKLTGTTIPAYEVLTTLEDTPVTLTTSMLPITDLEQRPDQLTYTLATLPLKGILSKAGINLSAGGTFTQADVDNGLILLTPKANVNGTDSFTFSVADGLGGVLANQTFAINVMLVNDAPTLTAFAAPVASGNEDNPISVTLANLQAQGNEVDIDGNVTEFVIKAVSTGILKIGSSAGTATAWSFGSNDVIDTTHLAYWIPDANANGILNAFTAAAKDNGGLESATTIQATVSVTEVPDVTVIAGITPVEGGVAGTFKINLDSPAPVGGLTINYSFNDSLSGSATLNTDYTISAGTNITAATAGSFTIAEGQTTAKLMINAGNDGLADLNETVTLNLMTGTGYQFSYAAAFESKVDFTTGSSPHSVSVGDFNGDGKTDLVVANEGSNSVSVLLRNDSNTGFDPKVDFPTAFYPSGVSEGDFNGDGKTDLAVSCWNNAMTLSLLLRNSDNTGFDPKVDIAIGGPFYLGDFNGDGKTDLAVDNVYSNTVSVLLRNGANTGFEPKVDYATDSSPVSVIVGDFNGDGKLDLATANQDSKTISVLLRNADNTGFDTKLDYATVTTPYSLSSGDFNGDGKLDLSITNYWDKTVSVLLRNADNTGFDPKYDVAITDSNLYSITVGDFNGDGKADFVVANVGNNMVSVYLRNNANTGFDPKVDFTTGSYPLSVSVADFNADGKVDMAVGNIMSNTVSVLLNKTISPSTLTIIDHNPANIAPTLTAFTTTVAIGNEDSQIAITFADLQAQGNEADVDGTVDAFVIKAVSAGSLKIGASADTATDWNASTNNTVDATHQAYWTPVANANGTLNAFTAVAKDNGGLESATAIQATVSVTAVNDIPTFTAFASKVASGNEDSQIAISFANLKAQGNEADVDGTVDAFVIKAVSTGSLKIGASADTATDWNASTNNTVDATHQAYWTPAANANGTLNAFTAVAKDNGGLLSATPVQAKVNVVPVRDDLIINGTIGKDTLTGDAIDSGSYDTLNGLAGNDALNGLLGNDKLNGGLGNDVLNGGGGSDTMTGGDGSDIYYVDNIGDVVTETNVLASTGGTDLVYSYLSAYTLGANVENLVLIGAAAINATGNALNNTLTGNAAANILSGLAGNDSLNGGLGADKLIGGKGQDNLTGGAGRDTFTFAAGDDGIAAATLDKILDYAKGAVGTGDLIDYSTNLTRGGNANIATVSQASINQTTGIATFAGGSGTTLADALNDITARFTAATNTAGEFAFFKVNNTGDYYQFISDGAAGAGVNDDVIQLVGVTSIGTIDLTGGNLMIIG